MDEYLTWDYERGARVGVAPEVPPYSETPAAYSVPLSGSAGTIPAGWLEAASAGRALVWSGGAWGGQYGERIERAALLDATNGDYFDQNSASTPPGWTAVMPAGVESRTDTLYSFWYLANGGGATSWKYRKQTNITIESLADGYWNSGNFGPVMFRDGRWASDVDYYFGLYADNAGAINEDVFIRVHLHWNAASSVWQVRGEFKDGVTETDGTYETLSVPLVQPLYFRPLVRAHTTASQRRARANYGTAPVAQSHTLLLEVTPPSTLTWGLLWVQMHATRPATGVQDYLFVGGLDFFNVP